MDVIEYDLDITNNDKRYHRILIDLYNKNVNIAKCYKKINLYPTDNDIKNGYMIINYFIIDDIISNFRCVNDDVNIICLNNETIQINKDIYLINRKNKYIKLYIFFKTNIKYIHILYDVYILHVNK